MVSAFFAVNGCQQTASRLTWSFARDDGILFSRYIKVIHSSLLVPVWALLFNAFVVFLMGCIYLASSTAFNALIGSGLVLQQLTFAIPATLLLYCNRSSKFLPASRSFRLGIFGWVANFVTVAFAILVLVFYDFPPVVPVTGGNMSKSQPQTLRIQGIPRITQQLIYLRLYIGGVRNYWSFHLVQLVVIREKGVSRTSNYAGGSGSLLVSLYSDTLKRALG